MSEPSNESSGRTSAGAFVFAGGGTGGHLYPALAVAERIAERRPGARCVFFCSDRAIDRDILSEAGAEFTVIPARPIGLDPRRMIRFLRDWPAAVGAARNALGALGSAGNRAIVVAMGGFVAAPVARAAGALKMPIALINLDAVPGKANRWIARRAGLVLASAGAEALAGARAIRPIVRRDAVADMPPADCRASLGLDPAGRTLFVTGGSQGSRTINDLMALLVERERAMFDGWQVYHQAGTEGEAAMQEAYDRARIPARVVAFCREMGRAWGAADLAITRCGAGAVAEVWANAVPAVFLPYPFHRDQHQRRNAYPIVACGGGVLCRDHVDAGGTAGEIVPVLRPMLTEPGRLASLRGAIRSLGPADGAERAGEAILAFADEQFAV